MPKFGLCKTNKSRVSNRTARWILDFMPDKIQAQWDVGVVRELWQWL
jgi:hypothetical protein